MTPLVVVELLKEILRLVNNLLEGQPMEIRRANAIIAFNMAKPLIYPLLPDEVKSQVDKLTASLGQ